jgi:hypothetical protein
MGQCEEHGQYIDACEECVATAEAVASMTKDFTIDALVESQDSLQEESLRVRRQNRILRKVIRALRMRITKLEQGCSIEGQVSSLGTDEHEPQAT